ncbi:MAG: VCBS repeat-containing protein, partial [Gammaproteobacteria bacterium]|nr:VCBS repeat-containing protein [Gammaproteobacteria bacterium]
MVLRQWVAVLGAALLVGSAPEAQTSSKITFSRVVTEPNLGRLEFVHAVADLNGDGRDDILAGGYGDYYDGATPEERLTRTSLHVFISGEDGSLRHAPELVDGTIEVRNGVVVADDFNGDAKPDLAVFDGGVYVASHSSGYGNPPQLFLSSEDGLLRPSDALAEAVRREHELRPNSRYSGPADLHLKSATAGDIDGDGDVDLWVDSIGGANISSHFMVNNGDGTFTIDEKRAPTALRYHPPESWYHLEGHLVDLDNDGDLDLALAQNRGLDPSTFNQSSIVLI